MTTACHCQCQSWVRDMVRVRDRETRTATGTVTVTETQPQLVACFYTVIYQSVFPTRTTSTPATSLPSGRLAAYGSSWYGRIWPKSAPHSTPLSLDSIAYNAYRIKSASPMVRHNYVNQVNVQGGIWKGYCHAARHRALVKVSSQAQ